MLNDSAWNPDLFVSPAGDVGFYDSILEYATISQSSSGQISPNCPCGSLQTIGPIFPESSNLGSQQPSAGLSHQSSLASGNAGISPGLGESSSQPIQSAASGISGHQALEMPSPLLQQSPMQTFPPSPSLPAKPLPEPTVVSVYFPVTPVIPGKWSQCIVSHADDPENFYVQLYNDGSENTVELRKLMERVCQLRRWSTTRHGTAPCSGRRSTGRRQVLGR